MGQPRHQPSAWNTFMACKRDFYYKYILRLHEQDEFEDEMTASTFGTIVHKASKTASTASKIGCFRPKTSSGS